ncbi:MAG TPA: glycosyltransferase family 4 protein [Thermoanaerobaculia bacterium]|jgi:glycogen(starch) synthase|nr:glycosyltransferase family 4 protein [Thermoanaerobaculia bacterium]
MSRPARRRRLLLLSEPYPPRHPGGAGNYTRTLARGLAARGHEVHVVASDPALEEASRDGRVRVHRRRLVERGWNAEAFEERRRQVLPFVRDLHRRHGFDLVHDVGGFLYADVLRGFLAEAGIPGVTHLLILMGPYLAASGMPSFAVRLFHDLQALQCGVSSAVITTSSAEQNYYRQAFLPLAPDALVLNGTEPREADPERVLHWRRLISPDGAIVLFMGGRLGDRVKGGDRACALASALWQRGLPVRLVGTDLRASETPAAIRGAIRSLGRLSEPDFLALLKAVDVVLCPSRYEAFGLLAVEAAAQGTTVFASAVGGHLDTIPRLGGHLLVDDAWERPGPELVELIAGLAGRWEPRPSRVLPEELTAAGAVNRIDALHGELLARAAS